MILCDELIVCKLDEDDCIRRDDRKKQLSSCGRSGLQIFGRRQPFSPTVAASRNASDVVG